MNTKLNGQKSIKLILHPGHGKCGSTSIQVFLHSNVDQLKTKRIYLPDSSFRFSFETEPKAEELPFKTPKMKMYGWPIYYFRDFLQNKKPLSLFEERIKKILEDAQKSDCEAIIISAENLVNIDKNNGTGGKIHKILSSYFSDVIVLYYIRRQDDYLISSWQQWAHKKGKKIQEYILECLNSHEPQFFKIAKFFEDIYGTNNVQVVPLNKEVLIEGDLIKDFCHRTQININIETPSKYYSNPSVNPYVCDILSRTPNVFLYHLNDNFPRFAPENDEIKMLLNKYVTTKDLLWSNDKTILNDEMKEMVMKHFEEENRQLHQTYFNYVPYEKVFGVQKLANSQKSLEHEIDKLKDVMALQMEIILNLLIEKEEKKQKEKNRFQNKLKGKLSKIIKPIKKMFH
ncbi:hypothetical protein PCC7424_0333 [Gloeothece citriformis PCC 7424]|uniref:Uncharacterized protein n=1 Tax=Gloeothece citriformis (strain PCC 7424) TaxID=65393 RepID=B7KBX8_GLOC7|nr:hypothetical protein [Gloeothece citriformis]ACK68801.1 hypothetical protein PCC7424_0333 [Gloeothece citriformis PCC 7424]